MIGQRRRGRLTGKAILFGGRMRSKEAVAAFKAFFARRKG